MIYPESIDEMIGGTKRSGFIRAIMAKKKAGRDFDPTANKYGKPKKGLENLKPKKLSLISKNIVEETGTRTQKRLIDNPNVPKRNPGKTGTGWKTLLNIMTRDEVERVADKVDNLEWSMTETKKQIVDKIRKEPVKEIQKAIGSVMERLPEERRKKLMTYGYPQIKEMAKSTGYRKTKETPEQREKRLARAREYKKEKGLVKGRTRRGRPKKEEAENIREYVGEGAPPEKVSFLGAYHSYDQTAPERIDSYRKIMDSPTLDAYLRDSDKSILIASRGTNLTSAKDLSADAQLFLNRLSKTARYQQDKEMLEKVLLQYPPENGYEYYLAGHSLAGAIVQQLKRDFPVLKEAVLYNPAFQRADLSQQPKSVKRIYVDTDFLYNLGGKYFRNKQVIPPDTDKPKSFFERIQNAFVPSGIKGHQMSNFKKLYGLGKEKEEEVEEMKHLKGSGITPENRIQMRDMIEEAIRDFREDYPTKPLGMLINVKVKNAIFKIIDKSFTEGEDALTRKAKKGEEEDAKGSSSDSSDLINRIRYGTHLIEFSKDTSKKDIIKLVNDTIESILKEGLGVVRRDKNEPTLSKEELKEMAKLRKQRDKARREEKRRERIDKDYAQQKRIERQIKMAEKGERDYEKGQEALKKATIGKFEEENPILAGIVKVGDTLGRKAVQKAVDLAPIPGIAKTIVKKGIDILPKYEGSGTKEQLAILGKRLDDLKKKQTKAMEKLSTIMGASSPTETGMRTVENLERELNAIQEEMKGLIGEVNMILREDRGSGKKNGGMRRRQGRIVERKADDEDTEEEDEDAMGSAPIGRPRMNAGEYSFHTSPESIEDYHARMGQAREEMRIQQLQQSMDRFPSIQAQSRPTISQFVRSQSLAQSQQTIPRFTPPSGYGESVLSSFPARPDPDDEDEDAMGESMLRFENPRTLDTPSSGSNLTEESEDPDSPNSKEQEAEDRLERKEEGDGKKRKQKQIDFGEIKWGTFKDLHKRYMRKHPSSKFKTLEKFAGYILKNPGRFSEKARKKAQFYQNVIKE